jgi:hypothetical protein
MTRHGTGLRPNARARALATIGTIGEVKARLEAFARDGRPCAIAHGAGVLLGVPAICDECSLVHVEQHEPFPLAAVRAIVGLDDYKRLLEERLANAEVM